MLARGARSSTNRFSRQLLGAAGFAAAGFVGAGGLKTAAAENGHTEDGEIAAELEKISQRLRWIESNLRLQPHRVDPGSVLCGQCNVLVVGAGIVGASIALELTRQGCQVCLVEADAKPASYSSTTSKSWAWINSNSKKPSSYHDLNAAAMELWRKQTLVPVTWCGALVCRNGAAPIHPPDYPQRSVSAEELHELEPGLTPGRQWSYYPTEGLLEPVHAAELMIAEARRLGCRTEFEVNALAIDLDTPGPNGESVALRTEVGTFHANCVVLAAGNFVPELLETTGTSVKIPTAEKPGLLVHTEPLPPGTVNTIVVSPPDGVHMLQRPNGSVVLGGSICDEPDIDVEAVSEETLRRGASLLPALSEAKIKECSVGYRPFPADGYPVVGFVPGTNGQVYVAMSHSGITLASLWGALASAEIQAQSVHLGRSEPMADTIPSLLRDYRPGRTMSTSVVMDSGLPKSRDAQGSQRERAVVQ